MADFFPSGFWSGMAIFGTAVCVVFGVDILLGSRFIKYVSKTANHKFHVDQLVVNALEHLKKASDHSRRFSRFAPVIRYECIVGRD